MTREIRNLLIVELVTVEQVTVEQDAVLRIWAGVGWGRRKSARGVMGRNAPRADAG